MKVLVGTASWSDKSLVASKKFYPKEAGTPEARLRFYATRFPLVEVDTSYYAIPLAQTSQAWAERTPAHFAFNMKAFRLFTGHATSARVLPPDLRAEHGRRRSQRDRDAARHGDPAGRSRCMPRFCPSRARQRRAYDAPLPQRP